MEFMESVEQRLKANAKTLATLRFVKEKESALQHRFAFDALSPEQKHEFALELVKDYGGSVDIMTLHFCNLCHSKECERHGSGTTREYQYCGKCEKEVCSKCDPSHLELEWPAYADFLCNECTIACNQTE